MVKEPCIILFYVLLQPVTFYLSVYDKSIRIF